MVDPTQLNEQSVVYSFGVGDDISFDLSLMKTFGCHVYAFDPTPKSISWVRQQTLPEGLHFFDYGIAPVDGELTFYPPANPEHVSYSLIGHPSRSGVPLVAPVLRLQTIIDRLGHDHLDVLKMDVEGAEYDVLSQIDFQRTIIYQLLVEFHHRFEAVSWQRTKSAVRLLHNAGYKTFYVSESGDEFSFIRQKHDEE